MANPTIVAASLDDKKLQQSIENLVAHVKRGLHTMLTDTNSTVDEMEAKLKSLGSLKIDTGGTNDGGTGRRTQQHEKLTKAVNDASEAVSKETQKLQDLQQSLSGASDREQNFISQKERAANTISQENELLGKQQSELAALKVQQRSLVDAEQRDIQAKQQNAAAIEKQRGAVKYYEEEIVSLQARLTSAQAKIDRFYEVQAKARELISSRLHAPSDQFIGYNDYERGKSVYSKTEQDVRSLIKALSELDNPDKKHGFGDELRRAYMNLTPSQDMANVFKRQQEEISSYIKTLQEAKKGTKGETRVNLDNQILAGKELLAIYKELGNAQNALNKTVQKEGLRDGGNVGGIKRDIEETQKAYDIAKRKLDELTQSSQQSSQVSQQKAQIEAQVAAKEKEIAETKGRIAAATKEQSEADKNASQAAKEKANIQSQVANQEKQVAEAKKQLTTATQQHTDAETKSSRATKEKTLTLDQQASAMNTAVQSERKYTDEVLRQAAAIRSSKEWQEKGRYWLDDTQLIDPSVYKGTRAERQAQGTLEEQLLRMQKAQTEEIEKQVKEEKKLAETVAQTAKTVSYKRDLQMSLAGFGVKNVKDVTDEQVKQYEKLDTQLAKLKNSYAAMSEEKKKSEQGVGFLKSITDLQKQRTDLLLSIKSQLAEGKKITVPDQFESLRQSIANVLGVQKENISLLDIEKTSSERLTKELKMLQLAYSKLSASRIAKGDGTAIADEIQRVQRALQKLQATQTRPTSLKSVMGLDEKTLDDIAYKMQRLASYRSGLNVETQTKEITQVNDEYNRLKKRMDEVMQKNQQMIASNTALGRSWNYMKNRLAFYFTVGASQQFVKNLIEVRSQYEMNERALGILINSAERGTQIFQELSNMALVSPYTLIELSTAAKQLTAYDVAAKDVVDTTRRLADMAAAVGIPIERLTYALGQIKAYGYLNARDARMFSNAGIPLVKQLSEYYTELEGKLVSTADVYDRIKKKAIGYNDVMQVVNKMTDEGGKFFDFQAKMADTLKVRLANLTLAWNNMLNDIGKSEQGILTWMIGSLRDLFTHWKELNSALTSVAWAGGLIVAMRALNVLLVKSGVQWGILSKQMTTAGIVGTTLTGKLLTVGASLKALVTSSLTWWSLLAFAVVDVTRALINMDEAQKTLNKSIRDGAKDNYDNISKFLEQYKELRKSLYTENDGIIDIDKKEASKAWESIREQIELTTKNADVYIGRLLSISNISERVRQGFNLLEDIAAVNAALKESGDDVIKLEGDFMKVFGFTIGDGTITNLKDYADLLKNITDQYGSLENAQIAAKNGVDGVGGSLHNLDVYLETLQEDLGKTTDSILNFIQLKGWSGDVNKIRETFSLAFNKIALENNLTPQQATQLRVQSAKAEYEAIQLALRRHIADENVALSKARNDNEKADIESRMRVYKDDLSFMQSNTAQSRVYWEDFTKWMGEQHKSEVQAMFKGQTSEQIKMLDFSRGEYNKWVVELAQKYAKEHGMSYKEVYDQLHNYILNANQWSIRIPLIIDIQSPSWLQEDFKNRLPDSTIDVSQYNTLSSAISDWQKKRKEGLEEIQRLEKAGIYLTTGGTEADREHYAEVQKEVSDATAALKAYNAELTKETKGKGKDPVLEALRTEIDLVKRAQSEYDKLTKSGASSAEALDTVYSSFGNTIKKLNVQLQGFGLPELELKDVIKGNPNETLKFFKKLREELTAQGLDKLERMKAVEVVLEEFSLKAKTYNLDMLTKGLNSELGKIKDEYELAVELDANPELGGLFGEMFGLNEDALNKLPRTYNQVMKRLQEEINKEFKKNNVSLGFDLSKMLSKEAFDKWVEQNGHLIEDNLMKQLDESRKYAIKVRRDEFKNQTEQWNKLIEKYGEYQSKIRKIDEDVADERYAIIKKYGEDSDIVKAIDLTNKIKVSDDPAEVKRLSEELNKLTEKVVNKSGKEKAVNLSESVSNYDVRRKAEVDFEEFQHTDYWVAATSQLSDFTNKGLRVLIDSLKEYKKEAKNLDPKKIKQLNDTIRKLEKELKSRNPFTRLADSIKEFKKNSEYGADEIAALEKKINALRDKLNTQREESGLVNLDDLALYKKLNEELKKMKMNYAAIGESNAMREVASSMNDILGYAQDVVTIFKAIGDANKNDLGLARAAELAGDIVGNLQASGQGFASGGWIGAIAGGVTDLIPKIVKWINKEDEIDDALKKSAITVTELQNAYKALEEAVEDAFGTAKYGAMQTARANKELQLAELKRQLQLEESRSSKNKDYQAIANLRGQIADLEREIANTTKEIVNDLLGITSVGSFAETLVLSMIEAFRQGEDYMKIYEESFEDMIDNMIMKSIVSKVIGDKIQSLWDEIEKNAKKRGGAILSEIKRRQAELAQMREMYSKMENDEYGWYEDNGKEISREEAMRNMEKLIAEAEADIARLQKEYGDAISPTPDDVKGFKEKGQDWKSGIIDDLKAFMDAFGIKFGEDDKKNLSGLKQGLQSMSENTAGALEAYMNGVSQQVYYHSSLLEQIRDSVVGLDLDVSLGVQSQILLQLQNSYQTQQAIQQILEGVLVPSGRAFAVELMS